MKRMCIAALGMFSISLGAVLALAASATAGSSRMHGGCPGCYAPPSRVINSVSVRHHYRVVHHRRVIPRMRVVNHYRLTLHRHTVLHRHHVRHQMHTMYKNIVVHRHNMAHRYVVRHAHAYHQDWAESVSQYTVNRHVRGSDCACGYPYYSEY